MTTYMIVCAVKATPATADRPVPVIGMRFLTDLHTESEKRINSLKLAAKRRFNLRGKQLNFTLHAVDTDSWGGWPKYVAVWSKWVHDPDVKSATWWGWH